MTEPDAEPTPSLIQQRMELQRRRIRALYQLVVSSIIAAGWGVVLLLDPNNLWRWLGVLLFVIGAILSVVQLLRVRRDTRAFEAQHGSGAGAR